MSEREKLLSCFKAYDVRGRVPDELNEFLAYRIGRAFAQVINPGTVVVGYDIRESSISLTEALIEGLTDSGCEVFNIGLCGTEQVYFATAFLEAGGGIMVTASHNPADYNGMKLVRAGARPVSGDTGLFDIERLAAKGRFGAVVIKGEVTRKDTSAAYVEHILASVDTAGLPPYTVVVNSGNGCAGPTVDLLEARLPFKFIKLQHEPDGGFPNGIPNPLLPENRSVTSDAVVKSGAALGVAWDGDFDRCFLFDEKGRFIEGYYIVGLLAEAVLATNPGAKIIHDPRLTWNTIGLVTAAGGVPVMSKTGHAFIKERMREEDAVYGGEMSAHHYFRDFFFCDSGMMPWLLVCALMARTGKPLSALVDDMVMKYPVSGEINRTVKDPVRVIADIEKFYLQTVALVDYTDGISMEFADWRFNLRMSNTEPLVRLNVEARGNAGLVEAKTRELLDRIGGM